MRKFLALALILVSVAAFAGSYSSRGFSSSHSYSSHSYGSHSYRSPSKSYSSPSYHSPTYARPSKPAYQSSPKPYSSPTYSTKRPVTSTSVRPSYAGSSSYRSPVVVHHWYGGYNGGFGSSPWFWLWLMDRPHQTTVVQGAAGAAPGASGSYTVAQDETSGWLTALNIFIGFLMLGGLCWLLVWGFRRLVLSR